MTAGPLPLDHWIAEQRIIRLALAMLAHYYEQQGPAFAPDAEQAWQLARTYGATEDPA